MSSRLLTTLGFLFAGTLMVTMEILAHRRRAPLATITETLSAAAGTKPGRITVVLVWWWLAFHFIGRGG
ncbi:MAG: DUF6186 family protein [Actinomycetes bacterium]